MDFSIKWNLLMKIKKTYLKPKLRSLGSLKTLVMGASGGAVESGTGAQRFRL